MKVLHDNRNSHVGHSNLIHGLTQTRYVELPLDLPPAAAGGRSGGYDNINIYN